MNLGISQGKSASCFSSGALISLPGAQGGPRAGPRPHSMRTHTDWRGGFPPRILSALPDRRRRSRRVEPRSAWRSWAPGLQRASWGRLLLWWLFENLKDCTFNAFSLVSPPALISEAPLALLQRTLIRTVIGLRKHLKISWKISMLIYQ